MKPLHIALLGLVLLCGGYTLGRYVTPAKVVVTEKVKEVVREVVVTQTVTEVQIVTVEKTKIDTRKDTRIEQRADGSSTTTVVEVDKTAIDRDTTTGAKTEEKALTERLVERVVEKERLVLRRPDWLLGAQAGVSVPVLLGREGEGLRILPTRGAVLGVSVERRIIGSIYGGVWANSQGAGGISVKVAF